jgi:NAD(P)-dependent dehydrogenase (short-subunit alcohol dehydrogenase family)
VTRFLVSPAASYVTGQTIHVNGGAFPTTRDPYLD